MTVCLETPRANLVSVGIQHQVEYVICPFFGPLLSGAGATIPHESIPFLGASIGCDWRLLKKVKVAYGEP